MLIAQDEVWLFDQEITDVFELTAGFLHIVGDRQQIEPVSDETRRVVWVALDQRCLIPDDLTDACDGIVTGMVVDLQLFFLLVYLGVDGVFDAIFERL